ncbi:unnamed protein product [Rotaria sordida]|uniref:Uncharacterized protein n=1 Tax=Rotaria sordida TaxID=392033 RepID=A0A815RYY6_9BILA|nr:unnamed protein product [Rotaria sordida]
MEHDFIPGADPEEIKCFLHGLGLITFDEYYAQIKQILKRRRHSSKMTNEQIQKKLIENSMFKDNLSKNTPLLCPRKRTSFSLVLTRKRAIKTRIPSSTQMITTTTISSTNEIDTVDNDQPLDLRLQSNLISKC